MILKRGKLTMQCFFLDGGFKFLAVCGLILGVKMDDMGIMAVINLSILCFTDDATDVVVTARSGTVSFLVSW